MGIFPRAPPLDFRMSLPLSLHVKIERWPIAGVFTLSRGSKTEAVTVTVKLDDGRHVGHGESVPYKRYDETPEGALAALEKLRGGLEHGMDRESLQKALPPGAARNALDCAFWDLEARRSGKPAYQLAGLEAPQPLLTAITLSLDAPEKMAEAARKLAHWPLLKIKLGAEGDAARLKAVRAAAPKAKLIVDANEGWTAGNLEENFAACAAAGVILIEQPLPQGKDEALAKIKRPVPVCADESAHDRASLMSLKGKYDAVNVKLDKTGGLTEALAMVAAARGAGFSVMAGCMVATSLAIAPALLFAQKADFADLDGAFLLAKDRAGGLRYDNGLVHPPEAGLWG